MLNNLLNGAAGISNHLAVVIGVSMVFFAVQTILSLKLYAQAWDQNRMLRQLLRELDNGASGRPLANEAVVDFPWLDWVLRVFPASGDQRPTNFTRENALEELDTRVASEWAYLLLQRMGIMAPLLGVVLTVIGFYWLEVDNAGDQSLQTILAAVTPLICGVGAGAILALVNQVLLQGVGGRIERLRMSARTWFDAVIWRNITHGAPSEAMRAIGEMETFASILVGTAKRHAESSEQIGHSTALLQQAASQFERIIGGMKGEMQGIPAALGVIRDATAASAQALQDLVPAGERAVANLDVSVAAFRTTIDQQFSEAAKLHHTASQSLAASVDHIQSSSEALTARTEQFNGSAAETARSLAQIDASLNNAATMLAAASNRIQYAIEHDAGPAQSALHGAANSVAQSAEKLSGFVEHGIQPAAHDLATLHHSLQQLQGTLASIERFSASREDVDKLIAALGQAGMIADAIAALPEQIRDLMEQNVEHHGSLTAARHKKTWLYSRPR
ncbi:hypothetical protein [Lacipirellula sp.]|uniref:hypothetical protein n=1 Tax=Lacipirellula sp. TaxID=2691419 RepID=UPI003D0F2960